MELVGLLVTCINGVYLWFLSGILNHMLLQQFIIIIIIIDVDV